MSWFLVLLVAANASADDSKKRPTDDQRGKELYERHCVACHGATAKGDGPATAALVIPIPDLQGQVKSDKAAIDLVEFGSGAMPAYEATFDADDARRVLKYMAIADSQPKPDPAPAPGEPAAPPPPPPADPDVPEGGDVTNPE